MQAIRATPSYDAAGYSAYWAVKRGFDLTFAASFLLVFSPVFLLIVLALWLEDGRPIFYRHSRIGRGKRSFQCIKFRTMARNSEQLLSCHLANDAEARRQWNAFHKLKHDPRVHWTGSLLRRSSLDELPQIFNILKGEMSVVGPRPIVDEEVARYGDAFAYYCSVKPGLTGLWQISGRNDVSYARRVELDLEYISRASIWLDLEITLKTARVFWNGSGAY